MSDETTTSAERPEPFPGIALAPPEAVPEQISGDAATIGLLRAENDGLRAGGTDLASDLRDAIAAKDLAYRERNACVAGLARAALALGLRAWLGQHPAEDATWDPAWRTIVFILLPEGQVSWHLHDADVPAFAFLRDYAPAAPYDGHSTPEKYERLAAWAPLRR